jgi:hypothetical protein
MDFCGIPGNELPESPQAHTVRYSRLAAIFRNWLQGRLSQKAPAIIWTNVPPNWSICATMPLF